jgi:hypothetical protein
MNLPQLKWECLSGDKADPAEIFSLMRKSEFIGESMFISTCTVLRPSALPLTLIRQKRLLLT